MVGLVVTLLVILTLTVCIIILLFRLTKKRPSERKNHDLDDFLCRFVKDGKGKKIGESIAIDGDILIVKSGKKYMGIPLSHIMKNGKYLRIKGLTNFNKAEELGKKWLKKHSKRKR
ncbi:MAG: hypothetical protein FE038_02020 [Thermoplasmata archaeon]|nr:MAG: hypothetical protein FE038_02020 [Thermoplasmata archaeon]